MAQKFQPIRFLDFSGGMNTKVVNHLMLDSEVQLAKNCVLDEIGCLKKRLGYSQIGTQITAGTNIVGTYYFNDKDVTYSQHVVACGDSADGKIDVYYLSGGTAWEKVLGLTDWNGSTKVRFESFLDYMFAFNGVQAPESWDGNPSTTSGSTNLTSAPTCKYGRVYQDRFYFANDNGNNQSRIYFSSVPTLGAITWNTDADWLDVNPEDGDSITALDENSGRLLLFKNNSMFRWNGRSTEADPIIDVGTSSQDSVKTINNVTYFFNRYGIYLYDGGIPYLISRKVQAWVDAIDQTALVDVCAEIDSDHYYLSIGNVTVDGEAHKNVWLVYNIPLKAWTVWATGDSPKMMSHYISSGARELCFGDDNGEIFKINDGYKDDTADIAVNIETKKYDLQIPEEEKQFTEVYIITEKAKGLVEIGAKLDDFPVETIGHTSDDVTRLPSNLQGKKFAVTLAQSGSEEPWSLQQIIFRDVTLMGVV